MKKIAFIIESLQCGGAEKSLVTLLQNMNLKKYQVDLILTVGDGDFIKFVPKDVNIKIINVFSKLKKSHKYMLRIKYALKKKFNYNNSYHNAQLYWNVYNNYIENINKTYDIAIAYNQGFATYFVSSKVKSIKKIAWLNTDYNKAGYNISFDIDKYKKFDKIVAVSKECQQSLINELKKIDKKLPTTVIKDITDIEVIKKLSAVSNGIKKDKNNINICSVGRLAKAKGWHLAIQAHRLLKNRNRNIKWYIIGEGPERKQLENLIKEKGLEKDFILLGYKENPYPYIKTCDIYVQTSLFEGLGLSVIEAAILKKPIVTTGFPSAYTIIENNKTGVICEMKPNSIANSIESYITEKELMNFVIENLSNKKNIDKEKSLKKIELLLN